MGDVRAGSDAVTRPPRERADYTGAIYGSLLAASVVVSATAGQEPRPVRLAALLIVTGLVFWVAHAYARLVGDRIRHADLSWRELRRVSTHEWPLVEAAFPPAAAALICGLFGIEEAAAWAALVVAIVGQIGWATFAAYRAGATRPVILVSAGVNLLLGLVIVALKSALHH
jgi:hypothetical protein